MKHFKELSEMETVIIDLDVLSSTVRVLTYGMPEANRKDVDNAMYNITDQIQAQSDKLRERFDALFDAIREESTKDEAEHKPNTF